MVCDAYRRLVKVGSLDLRKKGGERRQEVNAAVSDFSFIALEGSEGRQAQCDLGNPPGTLVSRSVSGLHFTLQLYEMSCN